jgi:phosphate transport system substrate-binding protein
MLLRKDSPQDQNRLALKFFEWCLRKGQAQALALDYVPLPDDVIRQIEAHWVNTLGGTWKPTGAD